MKHLLTSILLFLFTGNFLFAQKYFDTAYYYYYQNKLNAKTDVYNNIGYDAKIQPVWGTLLEKPNDSTYQIELFKVLNNKEENTWNRCIKQNQAGMLGQRITETPGFIQFFNNLYEPITIHTNTDTGQSWVCFANDSQYVIAKVTHIFDSIIFNKPTVIREYLLTVYNADSTINLASSFNGKQIVLADSIGIVSLPNFSSFPNNVDNGSNNYFSLCGILSKNGSTHEGLTIFTKPEHLYDVGDEFHIYKRLIDNKSRGVYSTLYDEYWAAQKVINKQTINDSIAYTYIVKYKQVKKYTDSRSPSFNYDSTIISTDTQNIIYNKKLDLAYVKRLNEASLFVNFVYDTCSKTVGYKNAQNYSMNHIDTCWRVVVDSRGYFNFDLLYQGVGIPAFASNYEDEMTWKLDHHLVYVKKGNCIWGTPYPKNMSVSETSQNQLNLILYPNPAQTQITIQLAKAEISSIQLLDITGKLILSKQENAKVTVLTTQKSQTKKQRALKLLIKQNLRAFLFAPKR